MMDTGHRLFARPPTPPAWTPIETTTAGETGSSDSESESSAGVDAEEIDEDAAVAETADANGVVFGFRVMPAAAAAVPVVVEEMSPPQRPRSSSPTSDVFCQLVNRLSSGPPTPVLDEPSDERESSVG
jgi:hypothetical protein